MNPPDSVDERFLEALLHECYHPAKLETLVEQVMARLETPATVDPFRPIKRNERLRWYSAIITVLAAALLLGVLAVWPRETNAREALRQVVATSEQRVDRLYEIIAEGRMSLKAMLWVQGGDRFVLRLPAMVLHHDSFTWLGSNGRDFWFAPALGPVLVRQDADWLHRLLEKQQIALPILHVSSITRRLQTRYALPLLLLDTPGTTHLQTTLRSPEALALPQQVDLWAQSNVIDKLVLRWPATATQPQPLTLTLTLIPSSTQPSNWYDHVAHHAETRRVVPAQEETQP